MLLLELFEDGSEVRARVHVQGACGGDRVRWGRGTREMQRLLGEITRDPGRVSEGHGEWSEIR